MGIERGKEVNGGDVTSGIKDSQLTSYKEYDRTKGSDGFSSGDNESGSKSAKGPNLVK